ncbi:hypothetical protein ANO11243_094990 [Dothideomycetidae sp. 11243]|nr:hypothetical protein ANO11243_094990 [fungal sp. No.11243]
MNRASIPSPDPRELLLPLLACLPTAFVSPRPPPALLPLLSPILRQRLQYANAASGTDGWLPLLSWDPKRASKLALKVEGLQLEPHPVSGEIELEDVEDIRYRRLDEETLQSRLDVQEFELLPIYVWCETDPQDTTLGPGWKLAELRVSEDREDGTEWYESVSEANDSSSASSRSRPQPNGNHSLQPPTVQAAQDQDDDDDDYWASYDQTPGRTPGKRTPGPALTPSRPSAPQSSADAEASYFAQYANVQSDVDDQDPDAATAAQQTPSTLHGNTLVSPTEHPVQRSLYPADPKPSLSPNPIAPRPLSPASASSATSVERLERRARTEADLERAELGVRRFIASEVRGLFRLARSVGMDRDEFDECIRREMDVVGMLGDEE